MLQILVGRALVEGVPGGDRGDFQQHAAPGADFRPGQQDGSEIIVPTAARLSLRGPALPEAVPPA